MPTDNPRPPPPAGRPTQAAVDDRAAALVDWVREALAPAVTRDTSEHSPLVWCPQWWRHPEAVARLVALHEAWSTLVADPDSPPDGASTWWLQHADPHLAVLLDGITGPFSRCTRTHRDQPALPWQEPPAGGVEVPLLAGDAAEDPAWLLDDSDPDDAGPPNSL